MPATAFGLSQRPAFLPPAFHRYAALGHLAPVPAPAGHLGPAEHLCLAPLLTLYFRRVQVACPPVFCRQRRRSLGHPAVRPASPHAADLSAAGRAGRAGRAGSGRRGFDRRRLLLLARHLAASLPLRHLGLPPTAAVQTAPLQASELGVAFLPLPAAAQLHRCAATATAYTRHWEFWEAYQQQPRGIQARSPPWLQTVPAPVESRH